MRARRALLFRVLLLAGFGFAGEQSVQAQAPADIDDVTQLRQRLDACEAELQAMRARGSMQPLPTIVPVDYTDAAFTANAETKDAAAEAAAGGPTIKKIDAIVKPNIVLTGRMFYDIVYVNQSANNVATVGQAFDGNDFRELRLGAKGSIVENVQIQFEVDFGQQGRPTFNDENAINLSELPLAQNFKVGRFKEYFSLEQMTSSRFITFMERAAPVTAFTPGSTTGLGVWGYSEDLRNTYGMGIFRPVTDQEGDSVTDDGEDAADTAFTARLTHLCWYDEPSNGRCLLEVGGSFSYRTPANNRSFTNGFAGFATRPEMRMGADSTANPPAFGGAGDIPNFVTTGTLNGVNDWEIYGVETAWVNGSLAIQAEAFWADVNRETAADLFFPGAYIEVSYFLTGEHRNFDRTQAKFDRVTPFENFFRVRTADGVCCGKGAWQVAARYSYIDLNDQNIAGGRMNDFTFGTNWYWNAWTRFMFNYVHSDLDRVAGTGTGGNADLFGMRFQVDF